MPTIIFNGKTYNDMNDMPANERQAYEQMSAMLVDKNGNGIPDLLEGDMVQKVLAAHSNNAHISVNGRVYHNLKDLPPDLRQSVDGAFQMLSKMGTLSGESAAQPQSNTGPEPKFVSRPFEPQNASAIEEDGGRSTFSMILIGIMLCFIVTAATIAIFVFMTR